MLIRYEDLVSDIKKEILKLINYLSGYFEYKITDKLIEEIERNTSFENFKKLESDGKFRENSVNETTGEKRTFFNLGPKNNWEKMLKKENSDKIETQFNNEMKEWGYL